MQFTFEEFDFCGENAARTASVMRAIADAVSPQAIVLPAMDLTEEQRQALLKQTGPFFANTGPMKPQPLGTVATHVSAAAVGDVPFPSEGGMAHIAELSRRDAVSRIFPADDEAPAPAPGGVDAEGYPWDERIHASSRATVADGTWRKKRGVDDALVAEVRAEWDAKLRSAVPAPPTEAERLQADHVATMPEKPTVTWSTEVKWDAAPVDPATVGFGAAPAPVADAWPDDILGPRTDAAAPFPQFMAYVGKRIGSGELDNVRLLAVLNEHGVPLLPALSAPEHVGKIPAIARQLAAI